MILKLDTDVQQTNLWAQFVEHLSRTLIVAVVINNTIVKATVSLFAITTLTLIFKLGAFQ